MISKGLVARTGCRGGGRWMRPAARRRRSGCQARPPRTGATRSDHPSWYRAPPTKLIPALMQVSSLGEDEYASSSQQDRCDSHELQLNCINQKSEVRTQHSLASLDDIAGKRLSTRTRPILHRVGGRGYRSHRNGILVQPMPHGDAG